MAALFRRRFEAFSPARVGEVRILSATFRVFARVHAEQPKAIARQRQTI
jgi:hypothetical protein